MFVIVRRGKPKLEFVAGAKYIEWKGHSFTTNIVYAKKYRTLNEALAYICPENEYVVDALELLWNEGF